MASTQLEICGVWDASLEATPSKLKPGTVHLWQRSLQPSSAEFEACRQLLSSEELEKAERYRVERPRYDFVLTRGTLRYLLAKYLSRAPHGISFEYTHYGKPHLKDGGDLHFNVSHSGGLALMGFIRGREIGVDVEKMRPMPDAMQLAERFFSVSEREDLRAVPGDEVSKAFFRCWTRKEAYIKAKGEGLSLPLHQFDVSIEPEPKRVLLATRPDPTEAARWMLYNIAVNPEYVSAMAVGTNPQS
jgi:4'-phosphopantetheinyl transferase